MKKIIYSALFISSSFIIACNGTAKNEHEGHDTTTNKNAEHVTPDTDADIKQVSVVFTNVDANVSGVIKEIVEKYLALKNALAADDAKAAASSAKEMETSLAKMDKSYLSNEQKKVYDSIEEGLKEHAEHIGKNGDNIKHQRSHFVNMSEDVYTLVKNFGAGKPVYHDHCPMAKDNQGAMWLSGRRLKILISVQRCLHVEELKR